MLIQNLLNRSARPGSGTPTPLISAKSAGVVKTRHLSPLAPEGALSIALQARSPVEAYRQSSEAGSGFEAAIREADRLFQKYESVLTSLGG